MRMTVPMYHADADATPLVAPRADSEAKGARGVISMSLGGGGPSSLFDAACEVHHLTSLPTSSYLPLYTPLPPSLHPLTSLSTSP